ncbi:MAG: hypothetical protein AB7O04_04805 [Hyphomonadaceae bacterium]
MSDQFGTASASGNGAALRERADRSVEVGFKKAHAGLDVAEEKIHSAVDVADTSLERARAYFQEQASVRPMATALTAAGVGLLLGLLLARR